MSVAEAIALLDVRAAEAQLAIVNNGAAEVHRVQVDPQQPGDGVPEREDVDERLERPRHVLRVVYGGGGGEWVVRVLGWYLTEALLEGPHGERALRVGRFDVH